MKLAPPSIFYQIGVAAYVSGIRIASLGLPKAKDWLKGRKQDARRFRKALANIPEKRIWIHCSSLGEFEQGRPIIDQLKRSYPDCAIVLSFFSPSGYNIRKDWAGADLITYLPADFPARAEQFVAEIKPSAAIFIKYDFWLNHLYKCYKNEIPLFLVAGSFRPDQIFFKGYGFDFKRALNYFDWIFCQNKSSVDLLEQSGFNNCSIAGDPRFDRVNKIATSSFNDSVVEQFVEDGPCLLIGSSWPEDEAILKDIEPELLRQGWKFIIASHDVNAKRITELKDQFPNAILHSDGISEHKSDILIIDRVGILSSLYRYADLVWIGGAFGKAVHNTLEAAVYGKPLIFGPNYKKFQEAIDLIDLKAAVSAQRPKQMQSLVLDFVGNPEKRKKAGNAGADYVRDNIGGTQLVLEKIEAVLND